MQPTTTTAAPANGARPVPLAVKLVYSAFAAVLISYYWRVYGPTNFLYFCDVALLFGLAAVWTGHPLLASMPAVGILLPQAYWCVDFLAALVGFPLTAMTGYMFAADRLSLVARGLSFLLHACLPFFLLWLVARLGYDRRALPAWTVLAWGLLLVCYFVMPAPPAPPEAPNTPVNINYVYGFGDERQAWMDPHLYLVSMMALMPILVFLPTHLVLQWLFGGRRAAGRAVP